MVWRNTSAKRSKPRPLLVVHSGNTTTGRAERDRMSSRVDVTGSGVVTRPVKLIMDRRETSLNPVMGVCAVDALGWTWMFAEPVPVRRPGVCVMGVEGRELLGVSGTVTGIGMTKTGLYLFADALMTSKKKAQGNVLDCEPHNLNPRRPV